MVDHMIDLNDVSCRKLPNFAIKPSISSARRVRDDLLHQCVRSKNIPSFWTPSDGYTPVPWPLDAATPAALPALPTAARTAFLRCHWGLLDEDCATPLDKEAEEARRREACADLQEPAVVKIILEATAEAFEHLLQRHMGDVCETTMMENVSDCIDDFVATLAIEVATTDSEIEGIEALLLAHL